MPDPGRLLYLLLLLLAVGGFLVFEFAARPGRALRQAITVSGSELPTTKGVL